MPDMPDPQKERLVGEYLDRTITNPRQSILSGPHLDIRRPNLHDTKAEFQCEFAFTKRAADDLFALYSSMVSEGEPTIDAARGIPMDFSMRAFQRNKSQKVLNTPVDLIIYNIRAVDYWRISKKMVFDLYLDFSARHSELEEQRAIFWSTKGRPPDHYARAIALRFAKLFAKELKRMPTIGTASYGDHASTEYGRGLEALFNILGSGFITRT